MIDSRAAEENRRRRTDGYSEEEKAIYRQGYNDAVIAGRGVRTGVVLTLAPGDPLPYSTEAMVASAYVEHQLRRDVAKTMAGMQRWKPFTGDVTRDAFRSRRLQRAQQAYKAAVYRLHEWSGCR